MLGTATACVQLSRSSGSANGVAVVTGALFAWLRQYEGAAALFADAVREGPAGLRAMPTGDLSAATSRIDGGFTAAFLVIACFAGVSAVLASTLPLRRL